MNTDPLRSSRITVSQADKAACPRMVIAALVVLVGVGGNWLFSPQEREVKGWGTHCGMYIAIGNRELDASTAKQADIEDTVLIIK